MSIQPQFFEIRDVGKTFKSTKKQYIWRFKLDNKDYTIELFTSVLSGKKKILQNGQQIFFDSKFKNAFQFPFTIGKNLLNIVQHGDKFELRINNQSFSHLWDNERTKRHFNYENKEAHDPYKPKDYAANYKTSTQATSRDQELAYRQNQHHRDDFGQPSRQDDFGVSHPAQERIPKKEPQPQPKRSHQPQQDVAYNAYDFSTGFDHGFDKFATYQKGSNPQGQEQKKNSSAKQPKEDDFFGEEEFTKDTGKNQGGFDFNFGGNSQAAHQQPAKAQSMNPTADLDDLLSGGAPQQQPAKNAIDFFNDNAFGAQPMQQQQQPQPAQSNINDIFGVPASQPQSAPATGSIFDGVQVPQIPQQQQPVASVPQAEPEKPKFVPNLNSFYTQQSAAPVMNSQQAQMQQMMMQQMMMQQQQQQYQTAMNPQQMMGMNNMYQQQQNYGGGMGGYGQDTSNAYGTSVGGGYQQPQQQQQQYNNQQYQQNSFATGAPQGSNMGGFGATNTAASVGASSGSTPFDMFN